ncbi:MAG: chemotaxis protein CheA [Crinalium sp.]
MEVAHVMEDVFVAAQAISINITSEQVDVLLSSVDWLLQISQVSEQELNNWLTANATQKQSLLSAIAQIQQPPTVAVPPIATPVKSPPPAIQLQQNLSDFSMLDLFRAEVESQVTILNDSLLALETSSDPAPLLEALMRSSHSIKSAARIVQLDAAVEVAHVMEDVFVAAQAGSINITSEQVDVLLSSVDWLLQISQVSEQELNNWLTVNATQKQSLLSAIAQIQHPQTVTSPAPLPVIVPVAVESPPTAIVTTPANTNIVPATQSTPEIVPTPVIELAKETPVRASTPVAAPSQDSITNHTKDRVVKVSADNLNRLMGLAGESLVAANWLEPFADSLLQLKRRQTDLTKMVEQLQEDLADVQMNSNSKIHLKAVIQQANECRQVLSDHLGELELFARRSANLSDRLYREVIASHMRPFADGVQGFPRMIRDLARKLGKQVKFEIIGKSTQVDRDILEKLEAPLTHILRNACDHGLESPEDRVAKGKPAAGTLRLEAAHRGGMLAITVSDDGRGVDLDRLRNKIVSKGMVSEEMASQLTEAELIEFLFLPGFSTAKSVTEVSGRGVGLDVVQSTIQEVGGMLRAVSKFGESMSFHLQLPLTLSVIRTLLVEIAGEPYAFPLTRIDRILMVAKKDISVVENRQYFTIDDQNIGLLTAYQVLELKELPINSEILPIIIVSDRLNSYGLVVDRFLGEKDFVVTPLDPPHSDPARSSDARY